MKETPLSSCERDALEALVAAGARHDGREFLQARDSTMSFGREYGSCSVTLGDTRILSQVTCEVVEPVASRPNEGKLNIAVHLSPMAAPHLEQGRVSADVDSLTQVLERNIKESRCIDLESLCIQAEESVWMFRVNVTILNHGGNLGDAANLAAVGALRHFHRPDVSVEEDGRVTILSHAQSPPIPTFMRKVPVCVTYALVNLEGTCHALMDPTDKEERVMTGKMVAGLNPHGDITSLVFPGRVALKKTQIMTLLDHAFTRAKTVAERVQQAVDEDLATRDRQDVTTGFVGFLKSDEQFKRETYLKFLKSKPKFVVPKEEPMSGEEEGSMAGDGEGSMAAGDDDDVEMNHDNSDAVESEEEPRTAAVSPLVKPNGKVPVNDLEMDSDEEEEEEVKGKLTSEEIQ